MEKTSNDSSILIKVNSESKTIPQNTTILELLKIYNLNSNRVVIELNRNIVKKGNFNNTCLKKDDEVEIVTFVGGG